MGCWLIMELFNTLKNHSLYQTILAINELKHDKTKTLKNVDLRKRFVLPNASPEVLSDAENSLINHLFKVDVTSHSCTPRIHQTIPIIPTTLELDWLNTMINDSFGQLFLDEPLLKKLQDSLKHYKNYVPYYQRQYFNNIATCDINFSILKKAYKAIQDNSYVYYESNDIYGNYYKGNAVPYKIEYSFLNNSFYFIMWNEQKKITFKSLTSTIDLLEILDKKFLPAAIEEANKYVSNLKMSTNPLVLHLTKKRNALERCCTLFANYDKTIEVIDVDTYKFSIEYYDNFDIDEIILAIHSLGDSVTVVSPSSIRDMVIADIKG
jgi:hypothetical protein